jgi:chromosome partitioning protein
VAASEAQTVLDEARAAGVQWVIIDSPPHNAPAVAALMRPASIVVVPVRPAPFDLVAASATIEAARTTGARAVAILNHAPPPSRHGEAATTAEARAVLEGFGATVLAGQVSRRAALEHALISGAAVNEYEPDGRAAQEIAAAWRQIVALIEGKAKSRKGS